MKDIVIKIKTFDEWKESIRHFNKRLGTIHVYRTTKLESFLSRTLPYCCLLPLNKRQRVRLRATLKYAGNRRASKALYKTLKQAYGKSEPVVKIESPSFDLDKYTWTLDMDEIRTDFNDDWRFRNYR